VGALDLKGRRVAQRGMVDEPKETPRQAPNVTDRADAAKRARDERLTAALRNNLRRRNPTERKISERPGVAGVTQNDQDEHG
jgi:hypothetical protein